MAEQRSNSGTTGSSGGRRKSQGGAGQSGQRSGSRGNGGNSGGSTGEGKQRHRDQNEVRESQRERGTEQEND